MDITTYALSKKIAAHAVSGVQSMSVSGQTLTINTKDSGVLTMTFPTPKDGVSVTDIDVNANNQIVFTMSDGTEIISGKIPTVKGDKGDAGFSPIITENADNTDKIYKLDITTADSTFTTPNLKGADGQGGTGGSGEENTIDSISVNGVNVVPDENKNVDITVPNIYVGDTEPIDDNMEVWFNPNGESSSIDVPIEKIKVNGELQIPVNKVVDITVPSIEGLAKTEDIPTNISELTNDSGYLTEHQDISGKVDKVEGKSLISDTEIARLATVDNYDDTQVKTQIQAVANGLMDSVGYSADYKTIDIIAKNGVKKSVNVAPIISHASITELSDVDTTNKATGKALVYNATTSKHEYADVSGTDEKVKMDASTDAKYLGELLDNVTIANENGKLKVKKLDGQEVTITEINYLKGLTMNVMDLVNMFSNGGVKIINTPVATYAELLTLDKSSFIEGISYLVYVLADENHDNAKTTYLVDKDSETPTYFGFADSQRDFTTNPIDLATEITGKLGIANMDSDAIKALFTVDDTYKTETATNNAFSTHGAKALYDELLLAIGNKANDSDLTAHKDDTDIHVSTEDRTKWDSAKTHADSAHAPSNAQENVLETVKVNGTALTPSNKAVNIDLSDYAKTTDIPTTLPANGGNASTVNGHTVNSDVPENAVFTDTTYSDATQIEHGLMSVDDKKKLDGLKKYTPDGTTITAEEDGTLHGVAEVTVDDALSDTSTNPVQNKVVKAYVDENVDFSTSTSKILNGTVEAPLVLSKTTRNLLIPDLQTVTANGITCTNNGDGTYTFSGTATGNVFFNINKNIPINKGTKYKAVCFKDEDYVPSKILSCVRRVETSDEYTFNNGSFVSDSENCWLWVTIAKGVTVPNLVAKPMITTDLDATYDDFVPYSGYDIKTCGKNLLNIKKVTSSPEGVTGSVFNGTITLNGTVDTSSSWQDFEFNTAEQFVSLKSGVKYTISTKDKVQKVFIFLREFNDWDVIASHDCSTSGTTFVVSKDVVCRVTVTFKESSTFNNTQITPQLEVGENVTEYQQYQDGGTVHIDSSTEFPLLGLKSFNGETNIISPGNVEVTYAKSDSGKVILDTQEKSVKDARKETTVNLLNPTLQTTTLNGVTCTNNGDGTYTLNGTATSNVRFQFGIDDNLIVGKTYKALGIPISGSFSTVLMGWDDHGYFDKYGRIDKKTSESRAISMQVISGYTCDNLVIKPMLTTNLSATYDDFVPYTGDGETLASDVAEIKKDLGGLTFSASGTTLTITDGTNTWTLGANS